jgi:alpha/beta hydrolase family protein
MRTLLCSLAVAAAVCAQAPKVTGPLPVTADSHPFLAANQNLDPLDLSKVGYVEEEFLLGGTANVYDWQADGSIKVKTADAPYTTRILVRRPADAGRFNGTVVVELPNTARRFDWTMLWGYVHNYVTDSGAAWVGITMPTAIQGLKKFNPTRYADVSFANPAPNEACNAGPNAPADIEDGLKWDAITQLGATLKSGGVTGLRAARVYLTTQGADLVTYINAIQPRAKVYDGFLLKSPGGPGRISRCGAAPGKGDPRQTIKNAGVPVIGVLAQGEVVDAQPYLRADSDDASDRFRIYEIAGAAHIDAAPYIALPTVADQNSAGQAQGTPQWPFNARCTPEIPLQQLPLQSYILNGAFANLDVWVRKGTAPPRAERITVKDGKVALDEYGNGLGGVRSPYVDVPAATYFTTAPGPGTCRELGYDVKFDWARLDAVYGGYKNYAAKVAQSIDKMARDRYITESDAKRMGAELIGK